MFCFPFGGGGASIFHTWPDNLPALVEIVPIQLPGREVRLMEDTYTDVAPLVEDVSREIIGYRDLPFVLFGHSMGAVIVFELARQLRKEHATEPAGLFVSGRRAPQLPAKKPPIHDLPESEFLDELHRLNGTPKQLLEHEELMQLMIPTLRADFELVETYSYTPDVPLGCPIIAFGGTTDPEVSEEELDAWSEQTSSRFSMHLFEGDHFFLQTAQDSLWRVITQELRLVLGNG